MGADAMSEKPIQLDTLNVKAYRVQLRKISGGPDAIFVQANDTGTVTVDFADGVNGWGKALELNESEYEDLRQEAFRKELADLKDIPTYADLYPSPGNGRGGASTSPNGNTQGRVYGETPAMGKAANDSNPAVESETPAESVSGDKILDSLQLGLDVVGLIPVAGEIADVANAGISLARGDYAGAALSMLSAVPFVGYLGTAGKVGVYGAKAVAEGSTKIAKDGGKVLQRTKLKPGSSEHKAGALEKYQKRGGQKNFDSWSKQYDTNMRNYQHGLAREKEYRDILGASEGTLKTPITKRQIDILKESDMYAGQLKTGKVSLTKENQLAIQKDSLLVKDGWEVEHILEKGATKPYLDALEKSGIKYKIGPQIPHRELLK
jgi:hypothetical protein